MLRLYLIGRGQTPRNANFKGSDSPDAGMPDPGFPFIRTKPAIEYNLPTDLTSWHPFSMLVFKELWPNA